MIDSQELLEGQYELVGTEFGSRWPSSYDECILVVNSDNTINDFYLYALDLVDEPSLDEIANGILNNCFIHIIRVYDIRQANTYTK